MAVEFAHGFAGMNTYTSVSPKNKFSPPELTEDELVDRIMECAGACILEQMLKDIQSMKEKLCHGRLALGALNPEPQSMVMDSGSLLSHVIVPHMDSFSVLSIPDYTIPLDIIHSEDLRGIDRSAIPRMAEPQVDPKVMEQVMHQLLVTPIGKVKL